MATKELSLIIRAVDAFSGVSSKFAALVGGALDLVDAKGQKTRTTLEGLAAPLDKIKSVLWDVLKAPGDSFLAESIKKAIEGSVDRVDNTGEIASRLGLSDELVGELSHAARMRGDDINAVAMSVANLEKNLVQFSTFGTGKGKEAFEILRREGLDLKGTYQDVGAVLPQLADALAKMSPERQQFVAKGLFGEDPQGILNLLRGGSAGLQASNDEARRFGLVFSPEQIENAHNYELAIRRLDEAWLGVKATVAGEVEPLLTGFLNRLSEKIAAMPGEVRNLGTVFRGLVSDSEADRSNAEAQTAKIAGGLVNLLEVGVVEAAKTGAELAVQTLQIGVAALGPTVENLVDAYIMLPLSKALHVDLDMGNAGYLKKYQDDLAAVQGRLAKAQADQASAPDRGTASSGGQLPIVDALNAFTSPKTKTDLQKDIDDLRNQEEILKANIIGHQQAIEQQNADDMDMFSTRLRDAWARIPAQAKESGAKVAAALKALEDTIGTSGVYGPPKPIDTEAAVAEAERLEKEKEARLAEMRDAFGREQGAAEYKRQSDQFEGLLKLAKTLEEAKLAATAANDPRAAERQRLTDRLGQQQDGLKSLDLGGLYGPAKAAQDQYAEGLLKVFDGETRVADVAKEATEIYEKYRLTLESVAEQVQIGSLQEFQATRITQQAADSARDQEQAERDKLLVMKTDYPEVTKLIDAQADAITKLIKQIGLAKAARPETFEAGLSVGLKQFMDRASDFGSQGTQAALQVGDAIDHGLVDGLDKAEQGFKNLGDIARDELRSILQAIAHAANEFLAFKLITGLGSALGFGASGYSADGTFPVLPGAGGTVDPGNFISGLPPVSGFRAGGGDVAAGAAYVVGERGPELFVPRGGGTIVPNGKGMGGGGGGGSIVVNQVVNVGGGKADAGTLRDFKRATLEAVREALQRSPGFRSDLKGALA